MGKRENSYPGPGPARASTIPIKKKGMIQLVKKPPVVKKEAVSGSSHPAVLRKSEGGPGSGPHKSVGDAIDDHNSSVRKKWSNKKESGGLVKIRTHFRESDSNQKGGTRFRVVLIQEGLGNLRDCFYYTKECLQNSAALFEGKKIFADHPTQIEEQIQPERSTKDILGYYENVEYAEEDDRGEIQGDLVLLEGNAFDWARSLLTNALEYVKNHSDAEFVGLSINAQGEAGSVPIAEFMRTPGLPADAMAKLKEAQEQGVEEVRPVSILRDAVSCDLVTEAGAGGKILTMMEKDKKPMKKKAKKSVKEAGFPNKKESKEKHETEGHEADPSAADDSGADVDHADADQDKALFAKMIKQYLGDGADDVDQEEAMGMAKKAYEAYQAEGMESHEAYEAAGMHMKMHHKISKSMAGPEESESESESEHESEAESEAHEGESEAEGEDDDAGDEMPPKKQAAKKGAAPMPKQESNHQLIKANAEIAKLRESIGRIETRDYLEKKLAASKRSPEFVKRFREALGNPKNKSHIDECFTLFTKAYEAGTAENDDTGAILTEKSAFRESNSGGKVISFADCAS